MQDAHHSVAAPRYWQQTRPEGLGSGGPNANDSFATEDRTMLAESKMSAEVERLLLAPCILCGASPAGTVDVIEPIAEPGRLPQSEALLVPVCEDCLEDRPIEVELWMTKMLRRGGCGQVAPARLH